jgi:branched-subunit amino acid transport protein
MTNAIVVVVIGIGSYLFRLSFIGALGGSRRLPPALLRALEFIAPSVLAALVLPALVRPEGSVDLTPGNVRLVAGILAGLVAWRTRNVLLTTGVGLGALWILQTAA